MNMATPEEVGLSSARLQRLRTVMQGYVDQGKVAGLITMVARRGKVAHFECFGMMDIEAGKPMRPDTIFRIYSMTKPITCVALMMLFEEGRFLLNDPVSKFIPQFADLKVFVEATETGVVVADLERQITIRDLLTHAAGLSYGFFEDTPVEDMYRAAGILSPLVLLQVSLPEIIQRLTKLPLAHQPGTHWRYSLAHDVVGYLISVIADKPFDVFLQERVFKPLDMQDAGFFVPDEKLDRLAALYGPGEGGKLNLVDKPATSPFLNPDITPSGGAGLVSTTSDYLRFAQMMLDGGELDGTRLLSRKTIELMTMNHLRDELLPMHFGPDTMPGMGYGLGFGICLDVAQSGILGSEGCFRWFGAAATCFWVDRTEELVGLMMPQFFFGEEPIGGLFQNLVYQAIVD
jgi:CubicO group peptidase (beta-lactamase class C family)